MYKQCDHQYTRTTPHGRPEKADESAFDFTVQQGINPIAAYSVLLLEQSTFVRRRFENLISYAKRQNKFSQTTKKTVTRNFE